MAGLTEIETVENMPLQEGWGDPIPWSEYPQFESWDNSLPAQQPFTTIDDRTEGRWRPYYETELDLARQRMTARLLGTMTSTRWATMEALRYYVFGNGPEIKAVAAKGVRFSPEVLDRVNAAISRFIEHNEFTGNFDFETHDRSREDGEALVRLDAERGRIYADFVEPDQLTEPRSPAQLYDWLQSQFGIDCSSFVPQWSFGVLRTNRRPSEHLGYHVVYDGVGRDWDFLPPERVVHIRRNVGRAAPRGVSDYMPVWHDVSVEAKLARNVGIGAALQAAIAWIEEQAEGTTQSQASQIGRTDATYQRPTASGPRTQRQTKYGPGSIIRPSPGRKYMPGPMGHERNQGFTLAAQYIFRRIGIRWLMPEYMVSGDASNANYASALVAESPFVKAREADQQFYGQSIKSLFWKVVQLAKFHGILDVQIPFDLLRQSIDIVVDFPSVATRNPTELVSRLKGEVELGTTSLQTAATELGRDYDEEKIAGAKPAQSAAPVAGGFPVTSLAVREAEVAKTAAALQEALKEGWKGYP